MFSSSMQATAANCSGGFVLGTGGRDLASRPPRATLRSPRVARPSQPGDIARIQAHEGSRWLRPQLVRAGPAVCVPTRPAATRGGIRRVPRKVIGKQERVRPVPDRNARVAQRWGSDQQHCTRACRSAGHSHPSTRARSRAEAIAAENTPTSQNWDFIIRLGNLRLLKSAISAPGKADSATESALCAAPGHSRLSRLTTSAAGMCEDRGPQCGPKKAVQWRFRTQVNGLDLGTLQSVLAGWQADPAKASDRLAHACRVAEWLQQHVPVPLACAPERR